MMVSSVTVNLRDDPGVPYEQFAPVDPEVQINVSEVPFECISYVSAFEQCPLPPLMSDTGCVRSTPVAQILASGKGSTTHILAVPFKQHRD